MTDQVDRAPPPAPEAPAAVVANLATYPPRAGTLRRVLASLAPQVDRLNLVLNGYPEVPADLGAFPNVVPILPAEDTRDTGKFLPDTAGARFVFLADDDIVYPPDYVAATLAWARRLGPRPMVFSHHGMIYRRPCFRRSPRWWIRAQLGRGRYVFRFREGYLYGQSVERPVIVDEIGTGVALLPGELVPPFAYMRSAQRYVDVRLARWCFERGIACVVLPHPAGWLRTIAYGESIYEDFSLTYPPHVAEEIRSYAFRNPDRGREPARASGGFSPAWARPTARRTDSWSN